MRTTLRAVGIAAMLFVASAARAADPAVCPETVCPEGDPARLTREMAQERLVVYMSALGADMSPRLQRTLDRIPELSRKLLAMKYYLHRSEEEIEAKWAWSGKRAEWYKTSAEYHLALGELAKVRRTFAQMNPGYTLDMRIEIRSLGSQIGKWNTTRSIATGAGEMFNALLGVIIDSAASFSPEPDEPGLERFKMFLLAFEPAQHPTVAVPGLSQHGQFRAFDFTIRRRGRVIAGTSTARIPADWDGPGWTERLREAICRASDRFDGPLDSPYEPWHYAYTP